MISENHQSTPLHDYLCMCVGSRAVQIPAGKCSNNFQEHCCRSDRNTPADPSLQTSYGLRAAFQRTHPCLNQIIAFCLLLLL